MKKIVNVNIGGYAFVIEEEAYERLKQYLEKVQLNLGSSLDANEVMSDIEMRFAELLKEQLNLSKKEVVEMAMVNYCIELMGSPEEFNTGENTNERKEENFQTESRKVLFRDPESKLLGGVASGLANYFGWNVLLVRILFVLLAIGFFSGFIIYVVLWILVPEARSTADRLRMKGEPVNIDTLKQRFNDFKKDIEKLGSKENEKKIKYAAQNFGSKVENAFSDFGKAIAKIIGAVLLIASIFLLILFVRSLISTSISIPDSPMEEFFFENHMLFFDNRFDYYCLVLGVAVLVALVLYGLISSGIELLFNVKLKNKPLKYITSTVSILATIAVVYGGINLGKNFSNDESIVKKYDLILPDSTLELEIDKEMYFNSNVSTSETDSEELLKVVNSKIVFGYPSLEIKLSDDGSNYLEVQRIATGQRNLKAIENAEAIEYNVTVDTGKVVLSPHFLTSIKNKYRSQEVVVTLYLADKVMLKNKSRLNRILDPYNSYLYYENLKIADEYVMDKKGFKPLN